MMSFTPEQEQYLQLAQSRAYHEGIMKAYTSTAKK